MERLTDWLANEAGLMIALSWLAIVALLAVIVVLALRLRKLSSRWHLLIDGVDGRNLERLLLDHLKRGVETDEELQKVRKRLDSLETRMATAKRYVGLVRYDAFAEVGGEQSFALAIYDERGNGIVISSLVGRSDCRVYCKDLVGGKGRRDLSDEEERAIKEAALGKTKLSEVV